MKIIFSLTFIIVCSFVYAQTAHNKTLYLELLGNSKHASINFDSRFAKKTSGLGYQVGIGGTKKHYSSSPSFSAPIGVNYTIGKEKHKAIIAALAIPEFFPKMKNTRNILFRSNINVGYRYESNSGVVLNAVWTPEIYGDRDLRNRTPSLLWFGIGAGIKI